VGNIGSHKRTKYGVVGSHVNLTSRIESYTIGGQILISETTLKEAGPTLTIREEMQVEAKGFEKPIVLYDLLGIGGSTISFCPSEKRRSLFLLRRYLYGILSWKGSILGEPCSREVS